MACPDSALTQPTVIVRRQSGSEGERERERGRERDRKGERVRSVSRQRKRREREREKPRGEAQSSQREQISFVILLRMDSATQGSQNKTGASLRPIQWMEKGRRLTERRGREAIAIPYSLLSLSFSPFRLLNSASYTMPRSSLRSLGCRASQFVEGNIFEEMSFTGIRNWRAEIG